MHKQIYIYGDLTLDVRVWKRIDRICGTQWRPLIDAISVFYELLISKCLLLSLERESDRRGPCQLIFLIFLIR